MAAGCPLVATGIGDLIGLFADGRAELLTTPIPESFAEGILMVHADPQRRDMGRQGRKACDQQLWTIQTDSVQEFLEEIYERSIWLSGNLSSFDVLDGCGKRQTVRGRG